MTIPDIIGFSGVTILLVAYFMNLTGKLVNNNIWYILCNLVGAGLACLASILISYLPFIILEGAWTLVSMFSLVNYVVKKNRH